MFGGNSNKVAWHWFLPTRVEFPRGMEKVVLGYEWDETFDPVPYEEPSVTHGASNGLSAGGADGDVEQGAVELTSTKPTLKKPPIYSMESNGSDNNAEEGSFTGTPVPRAPLLKQRSNSRDPEQRLKPTPGTLT